MVQPKYTIYFENDGPMYQDKLWFYVVVNCGFMALRTVALWRCELWLYGVVNCGFLYGVVNCGFIAL